MQVLNRTHEDLAAACETNVYTLEYLVRAGEAAQAQKEQQEQEAAKAASSAAVEADEGDKGQRGATKPKRGAAKGAETMVGNLRRSAMPSAKAGGGSAGAAKERASSAAASLSVAAGSKRPAADTGKAQQRQAKKWGGKAVAVGE